MMSLANAILQGLVPGEMRGRVMSVYSLIAAGFMPLGSMLLGSLGSVIGVPSPSASVALSPSPPPVSPRTCWATCDP
jgi:hypothetical protein